MPMFHTLFLALLLGILATGGCAARADSDMEKDLAGIKLPEGFSISLWARVPGARSLAVAPEKGLVFVGTRGDKVYAVADRDQNGTAEDAFQIASDLNMPNGVAWRASALYIAERHRLLRLPIGDLKPETRLKAEVLYEGLPDLRWHGWRYAAFGPDNGLYVAIGAACNVCALKGMEGTIQRFDPKTWKPQTHATGVRNSVGLDFHPVTGNLFFTDNGADWMGDDSPHDELNRADKAGHHFGFPFYGGGRARTDDFKGEKTPAGVRFPDIDFNAHVAPLGIRFYTGDSFPAAYRNDAFVAQHGSWNRAEPDGYRVMRIRFDAKGNALRKEVFAEGWLKEGEAWGRPVDVAVLWDGSLLVSDDSAGAIYRITYTKP
ncbi:sorbosone dehydrogenase family protein [Magnetospira sp. QH-2]|uniref:PQQ-dependent sugar dehydrogenase n=1 Tax=Magnetospira sp. (strain QH-2) TaxID=1288970 RepID=UPI00130EA224|nr:PQQ-dependent sugar dehydrogenase [Magnetospira sp. QH-2]